MSQPPLRYARRSISRKITHRVDVEVPVGLVCIRVAEQLRPLVFPDFRIRSVDGPSIFTVSLHWRLRNPILQEARHRLVLTRLAVLRLEGERVSDRDDPSVEKTAFPEVHQSAAVVVHLLNFNLRPFLRALSSQDLQAAALPVCR